MPDPVAYIIILNWNNARDTIECVESCLKIQDPGIRVLIVDNGSSDGSEGILRSRFPDVELIQTGSNLGFAEGNNVGIRHALAQGAQYVILLNNDTIVDPGFARHLIEAASADPSVGIATSKIYFYDRPDVIWYAGARMNLDTGYTWQIGYKEKDAGQHDQLRETAWACGCSMLITREVCEQTGLLDADFFCYSEDTDWSLRAKEAGYRVVFVPGSKIWHKISISTGGLSTGSSLYYVTRNNLLLLHRHRPLGFAAGLIRDGLVLGRMVCSLFTMRINKMKGLANIMRGARDYYRGRLGKRD